MRSGSVKGSPGTYSILGSLEFSLRATLDDKIHVIGRRHLARLFTGGSLDVNQCGRCQFPAAFLPISSRLLAVLEMGRTDPTGKVLGPEAYVFGDVTGGPLTTFKRAWTTAVLKAHGHAPRWLRGGNLSPESRAQLRAIDLHFHDLRHEAGSRLLEGRFPLHHVQQMLGHADISTTSTYLNVTRMGLQDSMRQLDEARLRCKPVANEAQNVNRPSCNGDQNVPAKELVN